MKHATPIEQRVIRVFISSTFRDMQAERDYLVKKVFPELRARCRTRQVEFIDVDLRWGITQREAERGEVVHTCLAEIDSCSYFVSLLGHRYGWIPDEIDEQLIEEHKWLKEQLGKSVTELEILHGVLNKKNKTDHAFFYFRMHGYIETLPPSKLKLYEEIPTKAEIRKFGEKKAQSLSKKRRQMLVDLKQRIRKSGKRVKSYGNLESLGKRVLDNLWKEIDSQYPAISVQNELERERAEHIAFAQSRARTYVPRPGYFESLSAHAGRNEPPLILIGESGAGKTSLLANWALEFQNNHPNDLVVFHFIGSTPYSADYEIILRRIVTEIKEKYELPGPVPDSLKDLRNSFSNWLRSAGVKGRVILLLDGMNQLEDRDDALSLGWLPDTFPQNVKVIGSTLPGPTLEAALNRSWTTLEVKELEPRERREVVTRYLKQFGKKLDNEAVDRIISSPQSRNPLYIRALLEQLRVFGKFVKLEKEISDYLAAEDVPHLYEIILDKMEGYYESDRESLVKDALSLIWASRRGLYENELLELLRDRNDPLPQALWSPFYLALQDSLVSRSGRLGFFHDYLRRAVQMHYLSSPSEEFNIHQQLSEYYEAMFSDSSVRENFRTLSLEAAEEGLKAANRSDTRELRAQGCLLMAGSLISSAVGVSNENADLFKKAWEMAKEACELMLNETTRDAKETLACGLILRARTESGYNPEYGNFDLIDEAIEIYKELGDWKGDRFCRYGMAGGYIDALYEKAVIGLRFQKWDVVEDSLREAQDKIKQIRNYEKLKEAHIHQVWGEYFAQRGWWDKAKKALLGARAKYAKQQYPGGVCAAEGWLGISLCHLGNINEGLKLVRKSLKFENDTLGSQEGVAKWLHYLGEYFLNSKEMKRALHALWLSEELREAQNHAELPKTQKMLDVACNENSVAYHQIKNKFNPRKSEFGKYAFLWGLGPFRRHSENPILAPRGTGWESRAVFNPAVWTDGSKVYLLYRAQGQKKGPGGESTSYIGLAESRDGINFNREAKPVMGPTKTYEKGGGCEDPRIVKINDIFYMTYTAYDGTTARLALAESRDLLSWKKIELIFNDNQLDELEHSSTPRGWCKSGAIYKEKIGGVFWMFFGDTHIWAATSRDLIKWEIMKKPILSPRTGFFDSYLVEPGPPPIMLNDPGPPSTQGIWLGYNGAHMGKDGKLVYSFGHVLLDPYNPNRVLRRCSRPLLEPTLLTEINGQVQNVVFGEGLVKFRGKWFLYYGMADTCIGVAMAE